MTLKERITEEMKAAMRAKESQRLTVIRMLLAAMKQKEVDERATLTDEDVIAIVEKQIKQRRDSISQYQAGGRQDLVDAETFELHLLEGYLPQQLSADEIQAEVAKAIAEAGASGARDMGKVMVVLKARLAGRADMGRVSAAVRSRLPG